MNPEILLGRVAWLAFGPATASADTWRERPDWEQIFDEAGAAGTIVVVDERTARSGDEATCRESATVMRTPRAGSIDSG